MFSVASGASSRLDTVAPRASLHAVVYDGDEPTRRAAAVIVERSGLEVVDLRDGVDDVVDHVRPLQPDLIVLELAMAGTRGLEVVSALLGAVPGTAVILLSPFEGLRVAALAAGAYDLVDGDDLRDLRRCLRRLVTERSAGQGQQELAVAVDEVAPVAVGEGPGDGHPEGRPAPAVEADEAVEDRVAHPLGSA